MLIKSSTRVQVAALQPATVYDMEKRLPIGQVRLTPGDWIQAQAGKLQFKNSLFSGRSIRLAPANGDYLRVNGTVYRGQLEVSLHPSGNALFAVNYVPLEEYLQGVVPNEVTSTQPMETLRAQAVAARTFTLYKMSSQAAEPYDLESGSASQVYKGMDSEQPTASQAVQSTAGEVMIFSGSLIPAFYHSNCGGHTANIRDVWGSQPPPYFMGVECGYCSRGPHFSWESLLTAADLASMLRQLRGSEVAPTGLEVIGRDDSGRAKTVEIFFSGGVERIKAPAFRMLAGPDHVRSTNFHVVQQAGNYKLRGRGWGHGVGLCQEGASGMARAGYSYHEILKHYYPGVDIAHLGE